MKHLIWFAAVLVLSSCAYVEENVYYTFDAVKNIQSGRGSNASDFGKESYSIHSRSRLLLRYEKLLELVGNVLVNSEHKFRVELATTSEEGLEAAIENLRVCPVLRSWMMLASWNVAHPYGGGDSWLQPGGDYARTDCIHGEALSGTTRVITFDASNWLTQYVRARNVNYGLIVINDEETPVEIVGDASGYLAPRVAHDRLTPVTTSYPYNGNARVK